MSPRIGRGKPIAPLLCGVVLLVVTPTAFAHAFCRTTTTPAPAAYDPIANGCWAQGTPLAWSARRIPYSLASNATRQITLEQARKTAALAFGAWNEAACPGNARPRSQAFDDGPVTPDAAAGDCGLRDCDSSVHDAQHVIVFRDDVWPHNDPNNTLAVTTVTYGASSGEIFDADIEINSAQHVLTVDEPPPLDSFDLQAILTHEAGHFFGLAHATSAKSVMYAQYQASAIRLTPDDVAGVCSIYPPTSPGCACSSTPGGSDRSPRGSILSVAIALIAWTGTRRRSKRAAVSCSRAAIVAPAHGRCAGASPARSAPTARRSSAPKR